MYRWEIEMSSKNLFQKNSWYIWNFFNSIYLKLVIYYSKVYGIYMYM